MAARRPRPRGETRRQILAVAEQWLLERGYHGFSFGQIASALDIQKGAVHYHFASKEALVTALFQGYRATFVAWASAADAADERALTMLRRLLEWQAAEALGERVGPLGVAGVEYASLPSAACAEAEGLSDALIDWLTATLEHGRDSGALAFAGAASDQARLIISASQGALQLARVNGAGEYRRVGRAILNNLRPSGT